MNFDPADRAVRRRAPRPQLARRDLLRGGLWLGVGLGAAPLLTACGADDAPGQTPNGAAPYPLARPDSPVTLPIKAKGPKKSKLSSTGKVKLKVKVTYTPSGGPANTETKPVKLIDN